MLILGEVDYFRGGVIEVLSDVIGKAAHHFLGIDPQTGHIIGSVAGNVLFQLGGKDNSLSDIGKVVLDNIISGKFHRKVNLLQIFSNLFLVENFSFSEWNG